MEALLDWISISPGLRMADSLPPLRQLPVVQQLEYEAFETRLLEVATRLSEVSGPEVFREVALAVNRLLGADIVLVGAARAEAGVEMIDTLAVCTEGELAENFSYSLSGTPCESVVGKEFRLYPSGVQRLFDDPDLVECSVEAYAAFPMFDAADEARGMIAAMWRQPVTDGRRIESLLRLFAERAVAELDRERSRTALREAEVSYRSIFNATEDPIFVHDWDSLAIVDVNAKACEEYGFSHEEFLRIGVGDFSSGEPPYTGADAARLIERAKRTGLVEFEWHRRNKDGSLHWDEVRLKRAMIGGEPRILAFTREITARKQAEAERCRLEECLRQAQKMEAVGQLTGGIAHDFNNILTSVLGYIGMALDHPDTANSERVTHYLHRAQASGDRARKLIQQMLTYSRGGRGEPSVLAVDALVREVLNVLESIFPSSIAIEVELPSGLPAVKLEPNGAAQALINLCVNARDAMGDRGRLRIGAGLRDFQGATCASCRQPLAGTYVAIEVADAGPGIAPDVLEHIFEPFFSTKPPGKGSGMGLATSHGILHEHGGHICVESRVGEGTAIALLVPPVQGAAGKRNAPVRDGIGSGNLLQGHIALVDDNAEVAEFMTDLLTSWGFDVSAHTDSLEARDLLLTEGGRFDLLLLDQTMPGITGIELAREVLRAHPELPVMLYTGHSDQIDEGSVAAVGVRALLRKPIDNARLRSLLVAHLHPG